MANSFPTGCEGMLLVLSRGSLANFGCVFASENDLTRLFLVIVLGSVPVVGGGQASRPEPHIHYISPSQGPGAWDNAPYQFAPPPPWDLAGSPVVAHRWVTSGVSRPRLSESLLSGSRRVYASSGQGVLVKSPQRGPREPQDCEKPQ